MRLIIRRTPYRKLEKEESICVEQKDGFHHVVNIPFGPSVWDVEYPCPLKYNNLIRVPTDPKGYDYW